MSFRSKPTAADAFEHQAIVTFSMFDEPDDHDTTDDDVDLRRLLELACDWYWRLDVDLRLVRLDGRDLADGPDFMREQLGRPPWAWTGMVVDTPDFVALRQSLVDRRPFYERVCTMRDSRGMPRYHVVSGEPLLARGAFVGFHGTMRDLTRHRRAAALATLEHAVTRSLATATTSVKILQAVMRVICESEQWTTGGFFRVEDDRGTTRLIAGWSGPGMSADAVAYYQRTTDRVVPPGGLIGKVIASGRPSWVNDLKDTDTVWAERVTSTGERATFCFPATVAGRVIGVFAFASREIREPDERLLATLHVVGEQVGQFLGRKHSEQVLRESEARFRALTRLSSDWYWEMDADLCLARVETRATGHAEPPDRPSIGKPWWDTGFEPDLGDWSHLRNRLASRLPFRDIELTAVHVGASRSISVSGEPIVDHRGTFSGYRGVGRDITERKETEVRIQHMATHDGLTGLPNRVLFSELLAVALRSAGAGEHRTAVLFVDLDRFKTINDTLGHDAGDRLLKETARRLTTCVRTGDVVARIGGDEFVVLLRLAGGRDDVARIAADILVAVAAPLRLVDDEIHVTASIGISMHGADAADEAELLRHADLAMYAVKHGERNGFRFFAADLAGPAR